MADVIGVIIPVIIVLAVLYRLFGGALRRHGGQTDRQARTEQGIPRQTQTAPEGLRDQLQRRAEALRQERLGGLRGRASGPGSGAPDRAREPLESPWIEESETRQDTPSELPGVEAMGGRAEPEAPPPAFVIQKAPALRRPSQARRRPRLAGFASRQGLRRAMIAREVLGPPKSLKSPGE